MKTLATALFLASAPFAAFASCNWGKMDDTAASCASGTQWDSESQRCVAITTS